MNRGIRSAKRRTVPVCAITDDLNTISGICNDDSSKAIAAVQQLANGASVRNVSALKKPLTQLTIRMVSWEGFFHIQLQIVNRTVTTITLVLRLTAAVHRLWHCLPGWGTYWRGPTGPTGICVADRRLCSGSKTCFSLLCLQSLHLVSDCTGSQRPPGLSLGLWTAGMS